MKHIAQIFGIIVILLVIDLGASNSNPTVFRLWPLDVEFSLSLGLCLSIIALASFFMGGMFMWLNSIVCYKKDLKQAKKRIKSLENKIKDIEKLEV